MLLDILYLVVRVYQFSGEFSKVFQNGEYSIMAASSINGYGESIEYILTLEYLRKKEYNLNTYFYTKKC